MPTAVILAGGRGTRLRPFTYHRPKPLMPVANKATIDYIIELIELSGIVERVCVLLDYMGDMLVEHLKRSLRSVDILPLTYKSLDTADAVRRARHLIDDDFLVLMGDVITNCDLADLWRFHETRGGIATVMMKGVDNPCHYGIAFLSRDERVVCFMEKPKSYELYVASVAVSAKVKHAYMNLANAGVYAFSYRILDILDDVPHLLDFGRHVFPFLIEEGYEVYGWIPDPCYWIDIGTLPTYLQANMDVMDGLAAPLRPAGVYSRGVWFERPERVEGVVRPPVAIGRGATIERGAVVGPYAVVGGWSVIEGGAVVERSVLMEGVTVGERAHLYNSVIGARAEISDNACLQHSIIEDSSKVTSGISIFGRMVPPEGKRGVAIELRAGVG